MRRSLTRRRPWRVVGIVRREELPSRAARQQIATIPPVNVRFQRTCPACPVILKNPSRPQSARRHLVSLSHEDGRLASPEKAGAKFL